MSETNPLEELKKKYPALSDEQLLDIMKTGAEKGLITVEPAEGEAPKDVGAEVLNALKKGDISANEALQTVVITDYLQARKEGKASRFDSIIDKVTEAQLIRSIFSPQPQPTPPQPQANVDIEKTIERMADKMAEALKTHKLEDEKARAEENAEFHKKEAEEAKTKLAEHLKTEEEEKKLEAKLTEKISPIQEQVDKRIAEVAERLKEVPPDKRKGLVFDLGELISEEVGNEIKDRVVDGLKSAFGDKESLPVTTTPEGKIQVDWYKLGERALKTLDKFIEKLPTQAPPKREVKEMPPLPKLPEAPPPPPPIAETPPPAPTVTEATPSPPTPTPTPTVTKTPPPPPQPEKTPEPEKPIITEAPKEQPEEAEKTESEPATEPEERSTTTRTPHRRKKASESN